MNILVVHEVDWLKKVTYEIHHLSELFSRYGHKVYAIDVPDPGMISFNSDIFRTIPNYHRLYDDASVTLLRTPIIPIKGLHRISAYFISYSHIRKILKKYKIDIVFLYGVVTNGQATVKACKELGIPVVHRTLDILHELVREKFLRKHVLKIEKSIYPKFDKVLCQTPFMRKWVDEMGTKDSAFIPQGVDSSIMRLLPPDVEIRNGLGINEKDKVVMYLGTTYSFSGLDFVIEKVSSIVKEIPEFKLLIVGGGPDLQSFKKLAKQHGVEDRVIFTGVIPYLQVARYCSLAKLFINPFRINEITDRLSPVKIFDLLSCGKPVIATPLQGLLHDFPIDAGIITYCQVEEFDKKIVSLLKDDSIEQMGIRGREYVDKNYTWTAVTEKILDEFTALTSTKS